MHFHILRFELCRAEVSTLYRLTKHKGFANITHTGQYKMADESKVIKGKSFEIPLLVDERGLIVGPQVFFPLPKSDFIMLTKVWSRLLYWAQFTLAIVITNIITISSKSFPARALVVETWQTWFVGISALVTAGLFIAAHCLNPKKKILKKIEGFFDEYE